MTLTFTGDHTGKGRHFGIVVSRFSKVHRGGKGIGELLLEGCLARLREAEVPATAITVAWVPGAFELPFAARAMALSAIGRSVPLDAIIALGAVIRGETPHFEYVAGEAARGLAAAGVETDVPMIFGVLTCDNDEQALARAGGPAGHKGIESAEAALEMATVLERIRNWNPKI
jgi:6,7-dimethyl-8-ribityllumazine synthase